MYVLCIYAACMYLYEFKTPYYHFRKKGQSFASRENLVENKKLISKPTLTLNEVELRVASGG